MKIYEISYFNFINMEKIIQKPVNIAIGFFDGVHIAHKELLTKVYNDTKNTNKKSVVITFKINNIEHIKCTKYLNTMIEKLNKIEKIKIDYCFILDITGKFNALSPWEFINNLYKLFFINCIYVGKDFKYGYKKKGDINLLKNYARIIGFPVLVFKDKKINNIKISSSIIRNYISNGQIQKANTFLGYEYNVVGRIIKGIGKGRKIGFPTANIDFSKRKLIPSNGVYACVVYLDGKLYPAVTNIGFAPTLKTDIIHPLIEVHIIGIKKNLYGKYIKVFFLKYIREEKKFDNVTELKNSIFNDIYILKETLINFFSIGK